MFTGIDHDCKIPTCILVNLPLKKKNTFQDFLNIFRTLVDAVKYMFKGLVFFKAQKIDGPWDGAPVKSMGPQLVFHKNGWTLG